MSSSCCRDSFHSFSASDSNSSDVEAESMESLGAESGSESRDEVEDEEGAGEGGAEGGGW